MKIFKSKTKNFFIRPLSIDDYEIWKEGYTSQLPHKNDWDSAHKKDSAKFTKEEFKKVLKIQKQRRELDTFHEYAIIDIKSKKFVGRVMLMDIVRGITQSAYLGYTVFNNHWGKGIAHEAVDSVIDLAFKKHNLHRLVAGVEPANKQSLKVVKKLGMKKEGISKRIVYLRKDWRDLIQFVVNSEDRGIIWKNPDKII
jgi:ribosomal-protein-alanine N-acetyltransferase